MRVKGQSSSVLISVIKSLMALALQLISETIEKLKKSQT